MSESVTKIWCPKCGEVSEYIPEMIRIFRDSSSNAKWICPKCGHREDLKNITLENSATFLRTNEPLIEFERYERHGVMMWTMKELKGKYNEYCLCHFCANWKPNTPHNCYIAKAVYEFDRKYNIVTPVWECAQFNEKKVT